MRLNAAAVSSWVKYLRGTESIRNVSVSIREPFATERKLA
jgi:hypothetical protein